MDTLISNSTSWPPLVSDPTFMKIYSWEKFDFPFWKNWIGENWTLSLHFTVLYVSLIAIGRKWMEKRDPLQIKKFLVAWNILLASFSIVAFCRSVPELLVTLTEKNGLHKSICYQEGLTYAFAFWAWAGTLSKVAELGDTLFIVLRKQPLIFLHPYHHVTVMIYTWFSYDAHDPCHRWFMAMNYLVHSLMYSYYTLKAVGVKLPRPMAMSVTFLQISQMFVGIFVNGYSLKAIYAGEKCDRREKNIYLALAMYASYFYLFILFFKQAYFKKAKSA